MTSFIYPRVRKARLEGLCLDIKVLLHGTMTESELCDLVNMCIGLCSPEHEEHKQRLLTIAQDLDLDEPDSDAYRFIEPAKLDSRVERP